jgi:phosphatidylglycerol:prolipoprotein diacylglycerol transferase
VRKTRPLGLEDRKIFDWAFWMLVVGIIGARFFYAYINYDQFTADKLAVLKIWQGGLVWYGGLVPAAIVGVWLLVRHKMPVLHVTDIGAAAIMLALGIGRWSCLMAGDDYGKITDSWLGIRFYDPRSLVNENLIGLPLHPTQLYMSVNCLWIFFATDVIRRKSKYAGQAFGWMLILYAVTRATFIEDLRGDFVERTPAYGHRAAVAIDFEKDEGSEAVRIERGTVVTGAGGVTGLLLSDVDLPAGAAGAMVHAISDTKFDAAETVSPLQRPGRRLPPQAWVIRSVEGLPEQVSFSSRSSEWYGSHLPEPPDYVSTSQWISIAIVLAGAGIVLYARKRREPGYAEAVAAHAAEEKAAA